MYQKLRMDDAPQILLSRGFNGLLEFFLLGCAHCGLFHFRQFGGDGIQLHLVCFQLLGQCSILLLEDLQVISILKSVGLTASSLGGYWHMTIKIA